MQVITLCSGGAGVEELSDGASIDIFPNPTTGKFTVAGLDRSRITSLEIHNPMGEEVIRYAINSSPSINGEALKANSCTSYSFSRFRFHSTSPLSAGTE